MKVKNIKRELLSENWFKLEKITFDYRKEDGSWEKQQREAYDRGNGAVILLYNQDNQSVILTRQFRMPTYLNGNASGMLIEACAGLLDDNDAETCIKLETQEETGYEVKEVKKIMKAYMSPGSVTEILHFFIAQYQPNMKQSDGGGLSSEQEEIEVLEIPFEKALDMVSNGEIQDAKTIMLLYHLKIHNILK
ncbi:MAG: GDP-mannose pyrophosphatase NudK [Cyclobacteriaceae bacterium]